MSPTDLLLATAILGAALAVLARSFRKPGGGCAGCHGACATRGAPRDTVQLGTPGRPTRCGP
ncbi:MAG: hypothetical protein QM704_07385 [Anaeromyxobacteraceae bacterium]